MKGQPTDPIYTALGQLQRAERNAAKGIRRARLTDKRMTEALTQYKTLKESPEWNQ